MDDFTVTEVPLEESIARIFTGRWQDEAVSMRVSDGSGNRSGIPGKYGADIVEYDFSNHHSDLLWNYLYGNGDAGAMTGYSYTEIIVYTLLAGLVSKLVITGFEYQINEDIKDGGLNKYLIRPVNYCGYRFCSYLGKRCRS